MRIFLNGPRQCATFFIVLISIIIGGSASAQVLTPGTNSSTVNILPDVQYLRDPSGKLSLKDILRPSADKAFRTFYGPYLSASDPEAVHWFRFEAQAGAQSDYRATVYFTDPGLSRAILFRQVVAANADVFQYDPYIGDDDSVTKQGGIGLPLRVSAGERRTIYLSIKGSDLAGRLELWEPSALDRHLRAEARWRYGIYGSLALAIVLSIVAIVRTRSRFLLFLPLACVSFGGYFFLLNSAVLLPSWLGSFKLPLFCTALLAMSVVQLAAGSLNTDLSSLKIRWWGFVIGFSLLIAAILSAFVPEASMLFSYVLMVAALILCLFTAVALLTLKNTQAFQAKAFQAALFASVIGVTPQWSLNMLSLGVLPHLFVAAALLFAASLALLVAYGLGSLDDSVEIGAIDLDEIESTDVLSTLWVSDQGKPDEAASAVDAPDKIEANPRASAQSGPSFADVQKSVAQETRMQPVAGKMLTEQTAVDEMTGVFNSVTISTIGDKAIAQVKRYERCHTAILLRIEDFDEILQTLGKPTSNRAAKLLAVTAMRELRESDALGRLQDGTFLAILPETDLAGAYIALTRMKDNLIERTLPTKAGMRHLNVSFSALAIEEEDETFETVIVRLNEGLSKEISAPSTPAASQSQAAE